MIISALIACIIWAFYTFSCWAAGCLVLRTVDNNKFSNNPFFHPAMALAFGVGLMGSIWSVIAVIPNGLQGWVVFLVLCLPLALGGGRNVLSCAFKLRLKNFLPDNKALRWLSVPVLLFLLLAPPMTWHPIGTDALAFYFAIAKLAATQNNFMPLPGYEAFSQIALPAEFSYAALMAMGSELAARMLNLTEIWGCALLFLALVAHTGAGVAGRWLSLLVFVSSTSLVLLISDGKTDLYGCMMGLATLLLFIGLPELNKKSFALMGLMAGFAVMAKLSYLPILVPMLSFLLMWRFWQAEKFKKSIGLFIVACIVIGGFVLLNFLPMVAKNYLYYNEPFAPFLFINGGGNQNILSQTWFSPENTQWILKTYPFVWTFGQYPMQHGIVSPLILFPVSALLFVRVKSIEWQKDSAIALGFAGLLGMTAWAIVCPSTIAPRYIFPALLAFMPLSSRGLEYLWDHYSNNKAAHFVYTFFLSVLAIVCLAYNLPEIKNGLRWAVHGPKKSGIGYVYKGLQSAESYLGENDRLFLASWERAPLKGKSLACMVTMNEKGMDILDADKKNSKNNFWENAYKAGTKAISVNVVGWKAYHEAMMRQPAPAWLDVKEETINDFYKVYVLTPKKDAPKKEKFCGLDEHENWKPKDIIEHE